MPDLASSCNYEQLLKQGNAGVSCASYWSDPMIVQHLLAFHVITIPSNILGNMAVC